MHRYFVRFLVAVLTFAIGVALSLALGVFTSDVTKTGKTRFERKPPCRKQFVHSPPISIVNHPYEPLKLLYLGATRDPTSNGQIQVQLLVKNESDQAVSGYSIACRKGLDWSGASGSAAWNVIALDSDTMLEPGESQPVTFSCDPDETLSVRVERAKFLNGSRWDNPRDSR